MMKDIAGVNHSVDIAVQNVVYHLRVRIVDIDGALIAPGLRFSLAVGAVTEVLVGEMGDPNRIRHAYDFISTADRNSLWAAFHGLAPNEGALCV